MSLLDEIHARRRQIKTDGYVISIGEWLSMYEQGELDIHPEFQRFFRWDNYQKTSLIESILLGIPLPPIFVSQRQDGIWDVIDGLQRLSTIFQFTGTLKNEQGEKEPALILAKTRYLPSLENKTWNSKASASSIPNELKLDFKRARLAVSIVQKESDDNAKYDLFERLNTGGTRLTDQEVRNCVLIMLNRDLYQWLKALSQFEAFQETIALSERPLAEAYDMELALRFVIFSKIEELEVLSIGDVGVFLNEYMNKIALDDSFDKKGMEELFKNTFTKIRDGLGDKAFKKYNTIQQRFKGGFLVSAFEAVSFGVAYNLSVGNTISNIEEKTKAMWSNQLYTESSGAGFSASRRIPKMIQVGRQIFKDGHQN